MTSEREPLPRTRGFANASGSDPAATMPREPGGEIGPSPPGELDPASLAGPPGERKMGMRAGLDGPALDLYFDAGSKPGPAE